VLVFDADEPLTGSAGAGHVSIPSQLRSKGYALIPGVSPLADGKLSSKDEAVLQQVGADIRVFSGGQIYVVCHVYGSSRTQRLLSAAEACSARAVLLLGAAVGTGTDAGPELVAFAAGPMLPRSSLGSRIELVLPPRMRGE
jgi:hypothetical protein